MHKLSDRTAHWGTTGLKNSGMGQRACRQHAKDVQMLVFGKNLHTPACILYYSGVLASHCDEKLREDLRIHLEVQAAEYVKSHDMAAVG